MQLSGEFVIVWVRKCPGFCGLNRGIEAFVPMHQGNLCFDVGDWGKSEKRFGTIVNVSEARPHACDTVCATCAWGVVRGKVGVCNKVRYLKRHIGTQGTSCEQDNLIRIHPSMPM